MLSKLYFKKTALASVDDTTYQGLLYVDYEYLKGTEILTREANGKFFAMLFKDTAIMTIHFYTPTDLQLGNRDFKYSINEFGELTYYDTFSFNVLTGELIN